MKEAAEKIVYAFYFAFGAAAGYVCNLFMHQHVFFGTVVGIAVAALAAYYSRNDIKQEIVLLKTVPANFAVMVSEMRVAFREATEKIERQLRQKRLLRRNRLYRTRRLLSA